ncbi:MAG: hypothetical protein RIE53_01050 [Rhodothermales bacterium]
MTEPSVKEKVLKAVGELPSDVTFEDVMEQLFFLYKIEQGLRQIDDGQGIPHAEVKKRLHKWHT